MSLVSAFIMSFYIGCFTGFLLLKWLTRTDAEKENQFALKLELDRVRFELELLQQNVRIASELLSKEGPNGLDVLLAKLTLQRGTKKEQKQ